MRAAALRVTVMSVAALAAYINLYRHQHRGAVTLWNEGRGAESGVQTVPLTSVAALTLKLMRAAALGSVPNRLNLLTPHTTVKTCSKTDSQDPNIISTKFRIF